MRCFLLTVLLMGAALSGCRKHSVVYSPPPTASANTLVEGTLINAPGVWTHSNSGAVRILRVTLSGDIAKCDYEYHDRGNVGSSGLPLDASPPSKWFIYVESLERIWTFDGVDSLQCHLDDFNSTSIALSHGTLKVDPGEVPSDLIPRLPADLQKLFPTAPTKPRPSI